MLRDLVWHDLSPLSLPGEAWLGVLVWTGHFMSHLYAPAPTGILTAQRSGSQGRHLRGGLASNAPTRAPCSLPRQTQLEFPACPCPPFLDAQLCSQLCQGMAPPH